MYIVIVDTSNIIIILTRVKIIIYILTDLTTGFFAFGVLFSKSERIYRVHSLLFGLLVPQPLGVPERVGLDPLERALEAHGGRGDEARTAIAYFVGDHAKVAGL